MEKLTIQLPVSSKMASLGDVSPGILMIDRYGNLAMRAKWRSGENEIKHCAVVPLTGPNAWRVQWSDLNQGRLPLALPITIESLRVEMLGQQVSGVGAELIGQLRIDDQGTSVSVINDLDRYDIEMLYLRLSDGTFSGEHGSRVVTSDQWSMTALDGMHEVLRLQVSSIKISDEL